MLQLILFYYPPGNLLPPATKLDQPNSVIQIIEAHTVNFVQ